MKKIILSTLIIIFFSVCFFIPSYAQAPNPTPGDDTVSLGNPINTTDIRVLAGRGIATALGILGSLALAAFVFGGFLWLTSAGNQDRIKKGTQTMIWAAAGVFLVLASYAILNAIVTGIGATGGGASQTTSTQS